MLIDRYEQRVTTSVHSAKEREIKGSRVTEKKRKREKWKPTVSLLPWKLQYLGGKTKKEKLCWLALLTVGPWAFCTWCMILIIDVFNLWIHQARDSRRGEGWINEWINDDLWFSAQLPCALHRLRVLLVSIPFSSFRSQSWSCLHIDVRCVWYYSLSLEGHIVKRPDFFLCPLGLPLPFF